jgi:hypothetical protein
MPSQTELLLSSEVATATSGKFVSVTLDNSRALDHSIAAFLPCVSGCNMGLKLRIPLEKYSTLTAVI